MTYPTYAPDESYEVGQRVLFNDTVYYKKHEGDNLEPGSANSWWVDEAAANTAAESQLQQQVADLEEQLTAAGFSVKYVRGVFCTH